MKQEIRIIGDIKLLDIVRRFSWLRAILVAVVLVLAAIASICVALWGLDAARWPRLACLLYLVESLHPSQKADALARIWLLSAFIITLIVTIIDSWNLLLTLNSLPSRRKAKNWRTKKECRNLYFFLSMSNLLAFAITTIVVVSLVYLFLFSDEKTLKYLIFVQIAMVIVIVIYDILLREAYLLVPDAFADDERDDDVREVEFELSKSVITLILIDFPIIVGVLITAFVKAALDASDLNFAIGVATGAVALHVVAGNLMSLILHGIVTNHAETTRTGPAPPSSMGEAAAKAARESGESPGDLGANVTRHA